MDTENHISICDTNSLKSFSDGLKFSNEIDALSLRAANREYTHSELNTSHENKKTSASIQITSADGFFNRKRGRPPKNRFVQVYKNLQPDRTPQAVFTSFKLEKQGALASNATETSLAVNRLDIERPKTPLNDKKQMPTNSYSGHGLSMLLDLEKAYRSEDLYSKETAAQTQKLVRSTGTFFPMHNSNGNSPKCTYNAPFPRVSQINKEQFSNVISQEMPEDLRVRKDEENEKNTTTTALLLNPQGLTFSYLQMFHLLNLYRQTQQQPQPQQHLPDLLRSHDPYGVESREATGLQSATINDDESRFASSNEKSMPFGYTRYRYNEDCGLFKCGYRQRQTHFHCDRNDCQYSFCDRARFFQHTARHKRLDELLSTDFKHFRPNVDCHYSTCAHTLNSSRKSSSHFHCLKCSFVCYETNKFPSHRRLHSKLRYFKEAGFRKIISRESCEAVGFNNCIYNKKQTHYHCLSCDLSFLSKAQFVGHKH